MTRDEARPFGHLLGARVRARRDELGLTQDDVARRCSYRYGMAFSRSVIDAIERGARDLTLPELAVVCAVLDMDLSDILRRGDVVAITGDVAVKGPTLRGQLTGSRPRWTFGTKRSRTGQIVFRRELSGYFDEIGAAERKAAAKLGITPEAVLDAADTLWGRTLTDERDARVDALAPEGAPARRLQALRGHVTRTLLDELRPALDAGKPRGGRS